MWIGRVLLYSVFLLLFCIFFSAVCFLQVMAKFKIGDYVRFNDDKLEVSSDKLVTMSVDVSDALGRVTGSVSNSGDTFYFVDIRFKRLGMTLNVKLKEDQLLTPTGYLQKKLLGYVKEGKASVNPDGSIAMPDIIWGPARGHSKGLLWPSLKENLEKIDEIIKKWKVDPERYGMGVDLGFDIANNPLPKKKDLFAFAHANLRDNLSDEMKKAVKEAADEIAGKKMPKSRCIKLLESYRAEREKVKKGRRFERCLRDSVVDEALERAIELLKEGK